MLMRVLLSTFTAILLLTISPDVIRAQENLPDGMFAISPDEPIWQKINPTKEFGYVSADGVETAQVYSGVNGDYTIVRIRVPPNTNGRTHTHFPGAQGSPDVVDVVLRVQSGTVYFIFREDVGPMRRADAKAYEPGSLIVQPGGVTGRFFTSDEEVVMEITHLPKISHRSSE